MTNTTDQQAVTAKDVRAMCEKLREIAGLGESNMKRCATPIRDWSAEAATMIERLASVSYASAETPGGTFACPICGTDTPHYHSPEEVKEHRETEAWVEESWQQARPLFFPEPVPATNQAGEVDVTALQERIADLEGKLEEVLYQPWPKWAEDRYPARNVAGGFRMTVDAAQSATLLPCPFCKGKAVCKDTSGYFVRCTTCFVEQSAGWESFDLAAAAWNRRLASTQPATSQEGK
jgi:hypothetical protein